jgi:hypothetical protein
MMVPRSLAEVKAVVGMGRTSPDWEIRESGYFLFLSYDAADPPRLLTCGEWSPGPWTDPGEKLAVAI